MGPHTPLLGLGLSGASAVVAALGSHVFAQSALVQGSAWTTISGIEGAQFTGLVLQTLFFPLSIISFMVALPQLYKSRELSETSKVTALGVVVGILAGVCVGAWVKGGAGQLLRCGVVFCMLRAVDDDGPPPFAPYVTVSMIMYFAAAAYGLVLTAPLLARCVRLAENDTDRAEERLPILGARGRASGGACSDADDAALECCGRTTPDGAGVRDLGASSWAAGFAASEARAARIWRLRLAANLVLLFPVVFFAASVLPDIWVYFSASGIGASAAATGHGTHAGPVVSLRVGAAHGSRLYAKLWPDLLVFYGALYGACGGCLLARCSPRLAQIVAARPRCLPGGASVAVWLFWAWGAATLATLFCYW